MAALEHLYIWTLVTIILGKYTDINPIHFSQKPMVGMYLLNFKLVVFCDYWLELVVCTVTGNGPIRLSAVQNCEVCEISLIL